MTTRSRLGNNGLKQIEELHLLNKKKKTRLENSRRKQTNARRMERKRRSTRQRRKFQRERRGLPPKCSSTS
jgi:hypothetical protein